MSVEPPKEAETILIYKEKSICFDASPNVAKTASSSKTPAIACSTARVPSTSNERGAQ